MKLSEAMMLGSTTCKMVAQDWNTCALGCAANAIGIPQSCDSEGFIGFSDGRSRVKAIRDAWPWLDGISDDENIYIAEVWGRFDNLVCLGKMTFEELVDYVRSIEPYCGECNRFYCTCKPAALPVATVEVAV